jgi:two-component system response regulator DctR
MAVLKVVIVEDDPMVVEITREFIKEAPGFEVVGVAGSGNEAVRMVRELGPQLVLLDNFLPDYNASIVIQEIRAFAKEIDFIMITAAKEVPVVQKLLRMGVRDYLIKPFLKQRLLQALANYQGFLYTLDQPHLSQADLDRLNGSNNRKLEATKETQSIKGFSHLTEEKILTILMEQEQGATADLIATAVGISTVSARRYLNLLEEKDRVQHDLVYGKQGRPTYIYRAK